MFDSAQDDAKKGFGRVINTVWLSTSTTPGTFAMDNRRNYAKELFSIFWWLLGDCGAREINSIFQSFINAYA